jgi:hypothetical protein
MSEGDSWGWDSYRVLGLITVSVLSLALFVVIELEVADPLLDIRIFGYGAFVHSLVLISLMTVVMFGVLFYVPQFLQVVQGWGALDSGLALLPQAAVMGVLMPIAGRVYDRFGPRWPVSAGLAIAALGCYLLHTITIDTSRGHLMLLLSVQAAGIGLAMMPIFTSGIAAIPVAQSNIASAFNNVVRNVSGALGVAVLTTILTMQRAELLAGRAALLPAHTPTPVLGPPGTPAWLGQYATYQLTQLRVFAGAIDNVFLICAVLSCIGAVGGLLMRSGPAPAVPPARAPAAPATGRGTRPEPRPATAPGQQLVDV